MRIYVEENFVRAAPGGIGYAKAAGNYGAAMYATAAARKQGYDQVLWTDALEHRYIQEIGTMNVFFIIGNKAVTPDLGSGTILAGVTRDSVITVLREMGLDIEERPVTIDELVMAYRSGQLKEVFGTGTAATVSLIRELKYKEEVMLFNADDCKVANAVKSTMSGIREGRVPDNHGWLYKV
jgi:branched-chain amino acid aminotransferase